MAGLVVLGAAAALSALWRAPGGPPDQVWAAESKSIRTLETPDAVCAGCHQAIYDRYEKTAMARGSGLSADGMIAGSFHHAESSVDYKVFARAGEDWMSFARAGTTGGQDALSGERKLEYFIGSGHRGRTFLYQEEGRWFELPINFYTRRQTWDMAPAFDHETRLPAPLPVDPNCLHCHASKVQDALPGARNLYAGAPFLEGGVGCVACHGDGAAHVASEQSHAGPGAIVNPAKLTVLRRDSACIQCHLEGDAVVYRPGRSLAQFQAGDDLSELAVYFVRAQEPGSGRRATSQYEALLRSACKRASGEKLTCTTCHDPHGDPPPKERVEWFREKCLTCHRAPALATAHHPEQRDCAACHMPSRKTTDISHEQVTDHDVEAKPSSGGLAANGRTTRADLVPVGGFASDDRTLGLAYAQMALRGDVGAGQRALRLLSKAETTGAKDRELEVRLGYLRQVSGDAAGARSSYTAVLNVDPYDATALANLAVLDAESGKLSEAVRLLERLTENDPSQTAAGLNLMFIDCRLGRRAEAIALGRKLIRDNPDDAPLQAYLRTGMYAGERCSLDPVAAKSDAAVPDFARIR